MSQDKRTLDLLNEIVEEAQYAAYRAASSADRAPMHEKAFRVERANVADKFYEKVQRAAKAFRDEMEKELAEFDQECPINLSVAGEETVVYGIDEALAQVREILVNRPTETIGVWQG